MTSEFEWDEANISHLARHGITPQEVEQVFGRRHVEVKDESGSSESRFVAHGTTTKGRYLTS